MRAYSWQPTKFTVLVLLVACIGPAQALSPSITPESPKVGQNITLTYKINDPISLSGKRPDVPETIRAGGITFARVGMREVRLGGYNYFRVTYSGIAREEGTIRIPSKTFRVGGKAIESESIRVRVGNGRAPVVDDKPKPILPPPVLERAPSARQVIASPPVSRIPRKPQAAATPPPSKTSQASAVAPTSAPSASPVPAATSPASPAPSPAAAKEIGVGSMQLPTNQIFVGEIVPVTLRYLLPAEDQFEGLVRPSLAGAGFTASALEESAKTNVTTNGASYNVVTLLGTISPFRSGKLKIPDADLRGRLVVPGTFRPASPGQFPTVNGGGRREIKISATGAVMDVLDLPAEGKPANFSGAIGEFKILAPDVSPRSAKDGEPIVLKLSLEGRGNLEAIAAPDLADRDGWKTYGPQESVIAGPSGSGSKTFEFTLVARRKQHSSPAASLPYFDPVKKKYLSLEWPSVPVSVGGPAVAENAGDEPPKHAEPTAARGFDWRAFLLPMPVVRGYLRQGLWAVLSVLLFTFLFFLAARIFLRRRREANEQLKAALADTLDALEQKGLDPAAFYSSAADVVAARLALWRGKSGSLEDLGPQLNRAISDLVLREEIAAILARRDELNYAGVEEVAFRPGEREAVFASLEKFCDGAL